MNCDMTAALLLLPPLLATGFPLLLPPSTMLRTALFLPAWSLPPLLLPEVIGSGCDEEVPSKVSGVYPASVANLPASVENLLTREAAAGVLSRPEGREGGMWTYDLEES